MLGHTADLLLEVDEAQEVQPEKFDRDFRPMAASTNAPVVYYGTPWGPRSLLAQAQAAHLEAERADGRRRHFRYDWEHVAAHNPEYGRYVEDERQRLGERHPLFRTQYLLEMLHDEDRLLDGAALAQLEGRHSRLRTPRPGERYVAGLDLGGPVLEGRATNPDRDWTVLTVARVRERGRSLPAIEVVGAPGLAGRTDRATAGRAGRPAAPRLAGPPRRRGRDRLGGPLADLLRERLAAGRVEPVVFQRRAQVAARLWAAGGGALGAAAALPQRRLERGGRVPHAARARPCRLPRSRDDAVLRRPGRGARRLPDEPRARRLGGAPRRRDAHRAWPRPSKGRSGLGARQRAGGGGPLGGGHERGTRASEFVSRQEGSLMTDPPHRAVPRAHVPLELREEHELPIDEIARRFRVSRRTVFRALRHGPVAAARRGRKDARP